jgi:hypothetical protein
MTFADIFKSSFREATPSFSLIDSVIALVTAFLVGIFIYLIYKKSSPASCTRGPSTSPW